MKIAVQGCAHGELENIYNTIEYIEKQNNITIDLLLCCGDFQATRNLDDLKCMAVPPKYRSLCTFYKYYSGEKLAPKLTIFIGGNHEASNYLQELPYGGWVAPNIYYLGYAGVINVAGIRIAGISGILGKGWDFTRGRYEKPPYNDETLRSCYHIRNLDVFRLKQLSSPVNIMLSHDWPAGITDHGNVQQLLKNKPFFKDEIESSTLGNRPIAELLENIKPDYWFAAHLHVKFAAVVKHKDEGETKSTKFLALDKCLPKRRFLQIIDIPHESDQEIELNYDLEWLSILYLTNHLLSIKKLNTFMPGPGSNERWIFTPCKEEKDLVLKKFHNNLRVPKNFIPTAPAHNSPLKCQVQCVGQVKLNPQTLEFCDKLSVDDPIFLLLKEDSSNNGNTSLNLSNFECSSFIRSVSSDTDTLSPVSSSSFTKDVSFVRSPLKLPSPTHKDTDIGQLEDDLLTSTPLEKVKIKPLEAAVQPVAQSSNNATSPINETENASAPGPKKFKRRNVAMYSLTEEE